MIPIRKASPARPFTIMETPEIMELMKMLERPAYQNLSRIHSTYYVELKSELRARRVNP